MASDRCFTALSGLAGMGTAYHVTGFPVAERLGSRLRFADAPCGVAGPAARVRTPTTSSRFRASL